MRLHRAEKQKRAVAAVQKLGAKVFYAHQANSSLTTFDTSNDLNVPGWLRQLAGDDFFQSVIFVQIFGLDLEFSGTARGISGPAREITDQDLVHLAGFPKLEGLNISEYSGVTDAGLAHLPRPDRLVRLELGNTSIRGEFLQRLSGSKRLEYLGLARTPLTDEGLSRLGQLP
jgi:hypothetical protein